jgi:lipopolysaccharide/colanic/teichoic acid biosynthesis glycosyltransferase
MRLGRRWSLRLKRAIDLFGAITATLVLSPLLIGTAVLVLAIDGRPILFRQVRPGRDGRPFTIYKFRTMRPPRDAEIWYRTDRERMTRVGRLLRATSVDELPELWNVVRGDMSLVGPRPLLLEYMETYSTEEHRRHDMRPGITSWAAVNGRHVLTFKDRLRLDTWYVDHWSLRLDARIVAMTVSQVLRRTDTEAAQNLSRVGFPLDLGHPPASLAFRDLEGPDAVQSPRVDAP